MKYSPEPWKVDEYSAGYIWGKNMEMIADLDDEEGYVIRMRGAGANLPQKENAERIVECVNALAGIDNPTAWVNEIKAENEALKLEIAKLKGDKRYEIIS